MFHVKHVSVGNMAITLGPPKPAEAPFDRFAALTNRLPNLFEDGSRAKGREAEAKKGAP